jgi:PadR family transcriptional regulator
LDASKTSLLQGTLDLLILRALSLGANHGLGIARRVQQITNGTFDVRPGSLFPALHRMEEQGWLRSEWGESETKRRAKYYELTRTGRKHLEIETANWDRVAAAMASAIAATS